MSRTQRVLITGVDGFLGTHISRKLLSEGDEVSGLIRAGLEIAHRNERIRYYHGELTDPASLEKVLSECEPDVVFHLAAQTFVPRSFEDPDETYDINVNGTRNLLDSIRKTNIDPVIIFSSSAEEYGLVYSSEEQFLRLGEKYSSFSPPTSIPELPVNENNPLRPLSPYGSSKVQGTSLMREYHSQYGLKTMIARNFNIEGPGRGGQFVTSRIIDQLLDKEKSEMSIGNVNIFKDWTHVDDVVSAFMVLREKGKFGEVYNVGSERTNSILTFILLSMRGVGHTIESLRSIRNGKEIEDPLRMSIGEKFGKDFTRYQVDDMLLGPIHFELEDVGITVTTGEDKYRINFDSRFFRPHDNPVMMSDTAKISKLGFEVKNSLEDIVSSQIEHARSNVL